MANTVIIKRCLLTNLSRQQLEGLSRELLMAHWVVIGFATVADLGQYSPDSVGTLLLDASRSAATTTVLDWCEKEGHWRAVPKLVVGHVERPYTSLLTIAPDQLAACLLPHLMTVQLRFPRDRTGPADRRRHFRQNCYQDTAFIQEATITDVSLGGAAMKVPCSLPAGVRVRLKLIEADMPGGPIDEEAEVVNCDANALGAYTAHVKFVDLSASRERLLQRYVLGLQTRWTRA